MAELVTARDTPVSEVVGDEVVRIAPGASLCEAAQALTDANLGALVVGDESHLTGIITERDVVHAVASHLDPMETKAGDVAHSSLIWCDATASVAEAAAEMMEHYVRHILVEDGGRLIGVLSARDLLGVYAVTDVLIEWEPPTI